MAPSQPWSVGGTLAMIFTVLPVEVPPVALLFTVTVFVTVLVSPQAVTPIVSRNSAAMEPRSRLRDIAYLLCWN